MVPEPAVDVTAIVIAPVDVLYAVTAPDMVFVDGLFASAIVTGVPARYASPVCVVSDVLPVPIVSDVVDVATYILTARSETICAVVRRDVPPWLTSTCSVPSRDVTAGS